MRRETVRARSGAESVLVDGIALHSRYDPEREAARFVDELQVPPFARVLVVYGEGIPYVSRVLRRRYPNHRIVTLLIGETGAEEDSFNVSDADAETVRRLLRSRLGVLDAGALHPIPWEPGRRACSRIVRSVEAGILAATSDLNARLATVGSFGMRWLRNALRADLRLRTRYEVNGLGERVMAATSGPLLSECELPPPAGDGGVPVVATSSARLTLAWRGRPADLLVHTDGGFWAQRYIGEDPGRAPVVTVARAAVPWRAWGSEWFRPVPIAENWIGEELFPDRDQWPTVPEGPSVAVTLLSFLHRSTPRGEIILAGFDVCTHSLVEHARPHPNDRFLHRRARRLRTEETQRAARIFPRTAGPLGSHRDGSPAYQTAALSAFQPEVLACIETHRATGQAWFARPSPAWKSERTASPPRTRSSATIDVRAIARPPIEECACHAAGRLDQWYEELAGDWGGHRCQELVAHLAGIEFLAYRRGELSAASVVEAGRGRLRDLRMVLGV